MGGTVSQSNLDAEEVRESDLCDWDIPEWNPSESSRKSPSWAALSLFIVSVAAAVGGVFLTRSHTNGQLAPAAFVISSFCFIAAFVVQGGIIRERSIRAEDDHECQYNCQLLREALNHIKEDCTLKGLAYVNFRQMRVFTVIAQRQARMSYYASVTAAAISLLVLLSGVAVTYGFIGTSAKITAACLTAAGSALSGFLAATFMKTYAMASRQMSYYYGQPLVHCYLLHAEWLASIANKHVGERSEFHLWNEVIKASIQASANAQEHLLSLQEAYSAESRRRKGAPPSANATRENGHRL
jgi:hypothetical protein